MRNFTLLVAASLMLAAPVYAQRTTASIRGEVTDPSHAIIVGAKVTLKGEATGFNRATTTNSSGLFSFSEVPVGTYSLDVEAAGFKGRNLTRITLNVADVR